MYNVMQKANYSNKGKTKDTVKQNQATHKLTLFTHSLKDTDAKKIMNTHAPKMTNFVVVCGPNHASNTWSTWSDCVRIRNVRGREKKMKQQAVPRMFSSRVILL